MKPAHKLNDEELKKLRKCFEAFPEVKIGWKIIHELRKIYWQKDSIEIFNLIRACEESYPAFTFLGNKKIFVTKAKLHKSKEKYFGTPGQIGMTFEDGSVLVITGNGVLRISKVKNRSNIEVDAKTLFKSSKLRLK